MENDNVVDVAKQINDTTSNKIKKEFCLIIPDLFKKIPDYQQIEKIIKNLNSYKNKKCYSHTSRTIDIYKIDSVYGNLIVSSNQPIEGTNKEKTKYRDVGQFRIDYLSINKPKIISPTTISIELNLKIYDEILLDKLGSYTSLLKLEIFKKPNAIKSYNDIVNTNAIVRVTKEMSSDKSFIYEYGLGDEFNNDEQDFEEDDSFEVYSESPLSFSEIEEENLACGLDSTKIMYYDGKGQLLETSNKKHQAIQILGFKKPDFVKQIEEMIDDWDDVYQETLAGNASYYKDLYKNSDRSDSRDSQR